MQSVNVHAAKTHLSRLLQRVAQGEVIVIAKAGRPIARLVPVSPPRALADLLGIDRGRLRIAKDFNTPLPDKVLSAFEGAPSRCRAIIATPSIACSSPRPRSKGSRS